MRVMASGYRQWQVVDGIHVDGFGHEAVRWQVGQIHVLRAGGLGVISAVGLGWGWCS